MVRYLVKMMTECHFKEGGLCIQFVLFAMVLVKIGFMMKMVSIQKLAQRVKVPAIFPRLGFRITRSILKLMINIEVELHGC